MRAPRTLHLHSLGTTLAYAYVLRVPLLIWAALAALPAVAVPKGAAVGPLLRGLFDLSDPADHHGVMEHLAEGSAFALVTLASLMIAATLGVTARLILRDGADRFTIPPIRMSPGIELVLRLVPAVLPLLIVAAAWWQSRSTVPVLTALAGAVLGAGVFAVILIPLQRWLWNRMFAANGGYKTMTGPLTVVRLAFRIFEWFVAQTPAGFIDERSRRLYGRHAFAFFQMLLSAALYWLLFVLKLEPFSYYIRIPTLCLVLILAMVVCWALAALSFTLDRFRIPVIVVLLVYGTAVSVFPQGDHFFPSVTPDGTPRDMTPAKVLSRRAGQPAIAVAAMGGGIHAGAWVARVLAGLQEDSIQCGTEFDQSLAIVSAVSGGSMGAMFILDAYENGRLQNQAALAHAVKSAEASSLDDVAWALVYPDLVWNAAPFLKGLGVSLSPPRLQLTSGPNLVLDRGTVLEDSWKRTPTLATATLDRWRADLAAGRRPAVIFNSTVVETGERMMLGTSTIDRADVRGRVDFGTDAAYAKTDVQVVTAARLSSTFPYVSPPARIQNNTVYDDQFHMVDGGYYDNYGTATLIEWLAKAIEDEASRPSRVMLLQIRTFPAGGRPAPDGRRGWLFETTHPLLTLFTVRGAAQAANANVAVDLLTRAGAGYVIPVTIEFPDRAYQDLDDVAPPLSWHLTAGDRKRLRAAWMDPGLKAARGYIQHFLERQYDDRTIPACVR